MKKPNRRTISIASDKRARIPFAMIGVLVLITSTTAVTVLNSQDEVKKESANIGLAMDRTEAATQAATREAVSSGLQSAAEAPVTEPNTSTSLGRAIDPDGSFSNDSQRADAVFRRYIQLKIYLNTRERIARTDQRLQDGTTTNASLPAVDNTESSVEDAIDRVEMDVGMYDSGVPDGQVQVTISDVQINVNDKNGTQLAQRTTSVNTSVPTTVFQLHEKNQEYEKRLNTGFFEGFSEGIGYGFGQKYAARQYPVSWAKVYFDRFSPATWGDAFDPVHTNRHTEILANDAIYSVQGSTFGTTDPYEDRIMRERWTCFGLSTMYKLASTIATRDAQPDPNSQDGPQNYSQLLRTTYSFNMTQALNVSDRQAMVTALNQYGLNEDGLCKASQTLLGDSTGDLPEAPSVASLVEDVFSGTSGDAEEQNEIEISVDRFADAAYYDMRGWGVAARLSGDLSNEGRESVEESDIGGDSREGHNTSEFEEPDPGSDASDFENQIGEIINGTYQADAYADVTSQGDNRPQAASKGGDWDEENSGYSVESSSLSVDSSFQGNDVGDQGKTSRMETVTVSVTNTLNHTREWEKERTNKSDLDDTTYETGTVTYTVTIDVLGQHSQGSSFTVRGVDNVFAGDSLEPHGVPNYNDLRNQAMNEIFGISHSNIESGLGSRINEGSITSLNQLENQIGYSTGASVDGSLTDSEYQALYEWIRSDINETRNQLKAEIGSKNVTRNELVSNDDTLESIRENVTDKRDEAVEDPLSGSNGRYANLPERARAEAQDAYIDAVLSWIDEVEQEQNGATSTANNKIGESLSGIDSSIDDALTFAQDALAGDVGTSPGSIAGTPQNRDAQIRVSGSPSYLYRKSLSRDKIPAARAENEGPADTNSNANHTGLTIKQDNIFLPDPGFPLIPWPGYWYATLSSWRIQMQGEYARFETTTTTSNPTTSSPTTYVRDERPVELEIDGQMTSAGRVDPISFNSTTLVVVVVPSAQVLPRGSPGIGDGGGDPSGWYSCTGTYPHVGPNAKDESSSCHYIVE